MFLPLILTGCGIQNASLGNENSALTQIISKKNRPMYQNLIQSSNSGTSSTNYQSTGYPSIYGNETHKTETLMALGSDVTVADVTSYHDIGVKVYTSNTAANIGSRGTIRLNQTSPYFDFTDASYMMPQTLQNKLSSTLPTKMLLSFNVEAYKGTTRYFHAGATINMNDSNQLTDIVYDKFTSKTTESLENKTYTSGEEAIDFSKIGKVASSLPSGEYTIKVTYSYFWAYADSSTSVAIVKTTATMSSSLSIDTTKPTITMAKKSGGSLSNGSYSNEAVTVTASDTNFGWIYYKTPGGTSYSKYGAKTYTTGTTNGWYYFYADDYNGNQSDVISVYIDTIKPVGKLYADGVEVDSGSYTSKGFSFTATDTGSGIKKLYYKSPSSNSYVEYSSGSIISATSTEGWYQFYAEDNAGNTSEVYRIFLETKNPVVSIKRNGDEVYSYEMKSNSSIDTGLYFNEDDTIQFDYSSTSNVYNSGTFNVGSKYALKKASYPNTNYSETITSATGVSTTFNFKIVRDKPTLNVNGTEYQDGANISLNKDCDIVMNIDSNITDGTNKGTISSGDTSNAYDLLSDKNATLTANDNETKTYVISISDAAGNASTFNITIDKSPADGVFNSNGVIIQNNGYTNKPFTFTWSKEGTTATISKDGGVLKSYTGEEISEDGTYTFVLRDSVDNTSESRITLDSVPPTGHVYVDNVEADGEVVTNKSIYFTWDGDDSCLVNGEPYKKNTVLSDENVYTFVLSDKAGNSTTYVAEIDKTAPTGNEEVLTKQADYTVSKWYEVSYNGKIECYKDYESALSKASEYEFNDSVEALELDDISKFAEQSMVANNDDSDNHDDDVRTGTYWLYKSIANENIKLYYFDKNLLDEAVKHYAESYVSDAKYMDSSKATGDEVIDTTWTYEAQEAPIGNAYVLNNFGSNEAYAIKEGTEAKISLNYVDALGTQLTESGLYTIYEIDKAGNTCSYKVIIDMDNPGLNVVTETYANDSKELVLDDDSMPSTKTFYLKSFEIKSIIDNDPYAVVAIEHDGYTSYYTKSDSLPTLTEGGKYQVRVYDRLGNENFFTVYISSEEEAISFKNNSDDTAVSINISLAESEETITSLEIYRNGTKLDGVSADKLSYTFSKDGNYKVILKDNFGRTIEKEYYFHKSLPTGTLNGVDNGGKTNNDVSFDFDSSKYYLEVYKDGTSLATNYSGHIEIKATDENSGFYEFVLINKEDDENRQSYNFSIDTISPDVVLDGVTDNGTTNGSVTVYWNDVDVKTSTYSLNSSKPVEFDNGTTFDKEGTYVVEVTDELGNKTTKTFIIDKTVDYEVTTNDGRKIGGDATTSSNVKITTNEEGRITVIKDGETYSYSNGEYLTEEGTYLITVEDSFGNKTSFTIVIDKSVDFEINVADGGISNNPVTINSNEKASVTVTKDGQAYSYNLGDEITEEGKYKALITDAYGNTKEVSFEIVSSQARTSIDYDLGDDVTITKVTKDGVEIDYDSNHIAFIEDGEYVVYYTQNGTEYSFTLRLDTTAPELVITGVSDGGKVDGTVVLSDMSEEGSVQVYKDGSLIDYKLGDEIKEYGSYKVVATDKLGNTRTYSFTLAFQMNGWAITLIVLGMATVVGLGATIVMKRKKRFKK